MTNPESSRVGELKRALALASQAGSKLPQATDELNAVLSEAEEVLEGLALGVRASVPIDELDDPGDPLSAHSEFLAFGKHDGMWTLLYERHRSGDFVSDGDVPLHSASRDVRLRAAKRLPALVLKLAQTAEAQLREVTEATTAVRDVLAVLKAPVKK